ncbi:hypothetical protein BOTBODRAFT_120509 [Botryobasidium botryosum FD-172 SS1]|uniref:Transcription initiation factor TFIID subunit 11 n=1 Tax=Botryobasidium botryosum (strain FD-172 SS1) TaxID=930990 RepID=A0A067LVC1_BOTB1|nr:hypothetical protein BOTBODRAFT_120509 [Botryobasidium botryosum FD-172 SS1]
MDNFSDDQHKRYEWYRRAALNKGNIRKVINQTLNHSVSPNVAQVIAGVAKVFVGEIVEKARKVQAKAGESGPLAPEHLREAYRLYQEEAGRVGAARPMKGKRIFMR